MKRMWEKVKETWREFWFVYEDEEDSTQHLSRSDKQSIWCGSFLMCAFTAVLCMAGIAIGNIRNNRQYEQDVEETLNMIATYFATATEDEYDEIAQTIRHDLVFSEYGRDMENFDTVHSEHVRELPHLPGKLSGTGISCLCQYRRNLFP